MTFNRIGRILVCLLVVCCLIVNIPPMRAFATGAEWVVSQVGTDIGVTAILEGLGIFRDAASDYFDELRNNVKNYLVSGDYVTHDLMEAYYFQSPLPQAASFYAISKALISVVRSYVFSQEYVYVPKYPASSLVGTGYMGFASAVAIASKCDNCFTFYLKNDPAQTGVVAFDSAPSAFSYDPETCRLTINSRISSPYVWYFDANSFRLFSTTLNFSASNAVPVTSHQVVTDKPLSLGIIAPSDTLFEAAYDQWLEHNVQLEDGSTHTLVQIGLGNTQGETESLTQEQIWAGQGTLQAPVTDSGTASGSSTLPGWLQEGITNLTVGLADILETLIAIPGAIVDGITGALTNTFTWAFAISDTFIATKVDALTLKYPYLDTFLALGVDLKTFLLGLGTTPPVIYINLGATNGSYNIGGQEVFMDLSWYAAYKPTMDAVLGGFIWLWLAWRIYLSIPGIISGASGVWGAFSRHGERSMRAGNKGGTE